jgi:hypothetical protein
LPFSHDQDACVDASHRESNGQHEERIKLILVAHVDKEYADENEQDADDGMARLHQGKRIQPWKQIPDVRDIHACSAPSLRLDVNLLTMRMTTPMKPHMMRPKIEAQRMILKAVPTSPI